MRCLALALAVVVATLVVPAPARGESGRWNLHLNVGVTGTAAAVGLMGGIGLDWQFAAPVALDLSLGGGNLGFSADNAPQTAVFLGALGLRIRIFDRHRGYPEEGGGRWGHWYLAPRVGYLLDRKVDRSYALVEVESGVEFALHRPIQVGPFVRAGGGFAPTDNFGFVVVGVSLAAELTRLPPPRRPARRAAGWTPSEDTDGESAGAPQDDDEPDGDDDGIADRDDACPDTKPGSRVDARGCAVLAAQVVLTGITFLLDSAEIQPASEEPLARAAQLLRDNPSARVEIGGHTCDLGTDAYNLKLSEARAAAVADWLVAHGIARDRLEVHGYGNTQPKLPNDSEEHRALNRRIEFRRLTP